MLRYDQFIIESVESFGKMYDLYLKEYENAVQILVDKYMLTFKDIEKIDNYSEQYNGAKVISTFKTIDHFLIQIHFNNTKRKIEYIIRDAILDEFVQRNIASNIASENIKTFFDKITKDLDYFRSNEYKSKRGIDKFNL